MAEWPEMVLARVFSAPRALVWKAWTEPERVRAWWGPRGFGVPRCEVEARPGGAMSIDMSGPDGTVYPGFGSFRELEPVSRLVFTSGAADAQGQPIFEILNTVTLEERGPASTLLTLRTRVLSARPEAAAYLPGQEVGWSLSLERLAAALAGAEEADRALVVTRVLQAPAERVFAAFAEAERMAAWWGPRGCTTAVEAMDARPGGTWRATQTAPDGSKHRFDGVFREVEPARRLVFTQRWQGHELLNLATFAESGGRTELTVTSVFASAAERDGALQGGMRRGMSESLDRLTEQLEAEGCAIVVSRLLTAPRELVYRVWTEPAHVARWWGPTGFTTMISSMDVRPGGDWRFVMRGPDGAEFPNHVRFVEVSPPERLVYDHLESPWFQHQVSFTALGRQTEVTVRMRFQSAAAREEAVRRYGALKGLNETLDHLADAVAEEGGR
jgi:uncharacterized protein YndB with AHSA1/START domain